MFLIVCTLIGLQFYTRWESNSLGRILWDRPPYHDITTWLAWNDWSRWLEMYRERKVIPPTVDVFALIFENAECGTLLFINLIVSVWTIFFHRYQFVRIDQRTRIGANRIDEYFRKHQASYRFHCRLSKLTMFKCRFVLKAKGMPGSEEWGYGGEECQFFVFILFFFYFFKDVRKRHGSKKRCCVKVKGTEEVKT